jgi:hypothetical protein
MSRSNVFAIRRFAGRRQTTWRAGISLCKASAEPDLSAISREADSAGRVAASIRLVDLLAQSDDEAFGPTDVAKPIRILVLHYFPY